MSLYRDHVLPRIVDKACARKDFTALRREALTGLSGVVVEIGIRSGNRGERRYDFQSQPFITAPPAGWTRHAPPHPTAACRRPVRRRRLRLRGRSRTRRVRARRTGRGRRRPPVSGSRRSTAPTQHGSPTSGPKPSATATSALGRPVGRTHATTRFGRTEAPPATRRRAEECEEPDAPRHPHTAIAPSSVRTRCRHRSGSTRTRLPTVPPWHSNVTIMFGSVEQPVHWARHLIATRDVQKRTGGFTEFVPLPFVHMASPIYLQRKSRLGPTFRETLLMHAVGRLADRDQIHNIQASWVKIGIDGVRQLLRAGVNDLGGTLMNENISRTAGATHGQDLQPADLAGIVEPVGRPLTQRPPSTDARRRHSPRVVDRVS